MLDQATQLLRQGNLTAAIDEAAKGYTRFHALSSDWAWRFLLLQADALEWKGLSEKALEVLVSYPSPPTSDDLVVRKQWLEASAYISLQRLGEAQQKVRELEELCRSSMVIHCEDLRVQGWLEMARGRFDRAHALFEQTVAAAHARHDGFVEASTLLDLGMSGLQQEHFDESMEWSDSAYKRALAIDAGHIAQIAVGNEGWAYYKLGDPEKALALLVDARERAHRIGATTYEVTWLTTIGYVYLDAHQYAKAKEYYGQALDLAQQTTKQDVIDALGALALVSERTGQLDRARYYADKTIAMVPADGNRLDVLYPMLVKGHVAARQHDTQRAEKIYREIEQDPKSHVFLKWEAEHSLAQLYEDENQPDTAAREYRAALSTFEGARAALHEDTSLPFPANAAGIYDDYIRFLINRKKPNEALQIAEYQRGRTLAEGLGFLQKNATFKPETLNAQAVARKVGGTILFYWLGEKQSYLWTITPQKTALFTLPPKSEIQRIVQRYRKALAEQQEFLQQTTDDGLALYHALVEPAAVMIPKNAKLFVIPDGTLNTLNFETLLVPGPTPHYWIEDVTLTDASSLRLLAASRTTPRLTQNLLLFGNAVAPNADYPELRKAAAEMESIGKHFPPEHEQVFARDQATPSAYLTGKPEQYSYIHFVAHGTASRMSPLDSAIVLSRSNAQEDSFKLYARDIIHHPVHAQLVTISTCYGAGARAYSGEGLVGLSWAFLRAGAHNVIGALWEVSDVSTPQLMDELYRELEKGKSPDAALRDAKLTLLNSNSYRKPFYWAPFQLYTGS
ncbi:MAG TPA: CHAT domain-containing protein [Candidatus Sulfotelmatobacter sp.]|nr:CHAT domain-containing protein [Candidatus Sulfotelmatobacter sp.]